MKSGTHKAICQFLMVSGFKKRKNEKLHQGFYCNGKNHYFISIYGYRSKVGSCPAN